VSNKNTVHNNYTAIQLIQNSAESLCTSAYMKTQH